MAIDIEKLIELEAVATPGPWKQDEHYSVWLGTTPGIVVAQSHDCDPLLTRWEDFHFLLALRNAAPELFKRIRELEERIRIADEVYADALMSRIGLAKEIGELRAWKADAEEYLRELQIDRKDALHGYDERYARKYGDLDKLLAPAAVEGE